jgi:hypothetical protein
MSVVSTRAAVHPITRRGEAVGERVHPCPPLPDDVLIHIVRAAQPSPQELTAWRTTSRAFRRVCTDNAVWAGRAHRPEGSRDNTSIWQDICGLPPQARGALGVIWDHARAGRVPESARDQLGHRQVAYAAHLNAPWLLPMTRSPFWSERGFVADLVQHGHLSARSIPPAFAQDVDMFRAAFAHDRLAYGLLPEVLKNDPKIAWEAVAYDGINLREVPIAMRTPAMGRMALATYINAIHHLPEPMRSDRTIWLDALPRAPGLLYRAAPAIRSDTEILQVAITGDRDAAKYIVWTPALRSNRAFAAFLVARWPILLGKFEQDVRGDLTVALAALTDLQSVHMVPPRLYDDPVYALAMVERDGNLLERVSPRLRQHDTILRAAIAATPRVLAKQRPPVKGRRDLVRLALRGDGSLLKIRFFKEMFGHDRELVLTALQSCPSVFEHIPAVYRSDREACLLALRGDANNWRHLVGDLTERDPEVRALVGTQPLLGFQYASEAVHDDRAEALAALAENGMWLEIVSPRLQADSGLVDVATLQAPHAIRWAAPHLRNAWRLRGGHTPGKILTKES